MVACLVAAGCSPGANSESTDRKALVWINALAVARPDYRVVHEENMLSGVWKTPGDTVRVVVEPRWPSRWFKEVLGRQDLEIRTAPDGSAVIPRLRSWRLSEAIRELGQAPDRARATTKALDALDGLARAGDTRVMLVVGFAHPMSESEALKISASHPEVAFFSPLRGNGGLPISWDRSGYCRSRGFDDCDPAVRASLTSGFRRWAELLTPQDAALLAPFELGLSEVKERAVAGLWHGAIYNVWSERAREIVEDPRVGLAVIGHTELQ
ncbi:hypothetical protein OUY22_28620 [Nonomuraea sp. MCN248]|uniref:Uncharacterized protein n=1 Tax=Nonomuraea corallina TaxID=2989783 RepID=A0ABT4SJL5_9ACTN|nr:hypothetical protein [Nonomuraea corallina]MDA0637387.1 hypothetical protein [Nonomuraea corallina]